MKINFKNQGQTLIETMVALFILIMGVSAAVGLAIYAFGSSSAIFKQIIANGLAREGIEAVRNMRDTNWLNDTLITNGCYNFGSNQPLQDDCYTNWLGDKTVSVTPFCLNPVAASSASTATGQIIFGADDNGTAYLNGSQLSPSVVNWSYDIVYNGLTFQGGENVFAARITDSTTNGWGFAGLIAEVTIGSARSGSNSSWKSLKSSTTPPMQGSLNWYDRDYDDSSWSNSVDNGSYGSYPWNTSLTNMPIDTPARWILDIINPPQNPSVVYFRGHINNSFNCSNSSYDVGLPYTLSFDSSSADFWSLTRSDTNFGLRTNTPSSGNWQQNGFYSPNGGIPCDNSSGNSEYCRSVVLTKMTNILPYKTAIDAGDTSTYLLKVQSQVWWTDKKCPRAATFAQAPRACRLELDTYLTNWKK